MSGRGRNGPESAGTQVAIRKWISSIKPYLRAQLTNPAQAKLQIMSLALAHGLTAALCYDHQSSPSKTKPSIKSTLAKKRIKWNVILIWRFDDENYYNLWSITIWASYANLVCVWDIIHLETQRSSGDAIPSGLIGGLFLLN